MDINKGKILVTGGLGFIGSHTVVELIAAGYEVVIADDLSNAQLFILDNIEKISNAKPSFYQIDVADKISLSGVLNKILMRSFILLHLKPLENL